MAVVAAGFMLYRRWATPKSGSMENIASLGAELTAGSFNGEEAPACEKGDKSGKSCLDLVANYMGSKNGFHADRPDQASCAAVAVILSRDKRGDMIPNANAWMDMLKIGKGPGPDALRLAVARAMASEAPNVGQDYEDEAGAKKLIAAVEAAIPGACDTYAAIARGDAVDAMPPELHPDHSACVQRDLARREGPGGRYGTGVFRAAEAAASLWRAEERMLRIGNTNAAPAAQKFVTDKLAMTEPLTAKISLKKVQSADEIQEVNFMGDVHAEAGVRLFRPDGGWGDGGRPKGGIPVRFAPPER